MDSSSMFPMKTQSDGRDELESSSCLNRSADRPKNLRRNIECFLFAKLKSPFDRSAPLGVIPGDSPSTCPFAARHAQTNHHHTVSTAHKCLCMAGMEAFEQTVRAATSKPVQRAAVNTALFALRALGLFFLSAIAIGVFFYDFVPDYRMKIPVHLQYGFVDSEKLKVQQLTNRLLRLSPHPYGVASLTKPPMIRSQQEYDISVLLSVPRSPENVNRGNFMIRLYFFEAEAEQKLHTDALNFANFHEDFGSHKIVFSSRRPALVPYVDPMVSVTRRLLLLLFHVFSPSFQAYTLNVALAERFSFSRYKGLPASAYIEIEAGQDLRIYSAALTLTAQLSGLRWLMFHYRLPTYLAFTLVFWLCEVLFMGLAWAVWAFVRGAGRSRIFKTGRSADTTSVKEERTAEESWDHSHIAPVYGRQPTLIHEPLVKKEQEEANIGMHELAKFEPEADDEAEMRPTPDMVGRQEYDSGVGTSFSERGSGSGTGSGNIRRRASRGTLK